MCQARVERRVEQTFGRDRTEHDDGGRAHAHLGRDRRDARERGPRDALSRRRPVLHDRDGGRGAPGVLPYARRCLLYTSDAADE